MEYNPRETFDKKYGDFTPSNENLKEFYKRYSKHLEEQNKQMLEALIKLHRDKCCCIDCDLYNHALDKETTEFIKSITKK